MPNSFIKAYYLLLVENQSFEGFELLKEYGYCAPLEDNNEY
jgi:hypothetical protein